MFAKLLEILLQSKSAAISAVFVIGTTGALVSATTQNGVTTITVTQATQSPLASPTHTAPPTPSAAAAAPVDSTTGAGSDCSADAHARSAAVGDVNRTFATDVAALAKLAHNKGEKARQTAQTTDRLLMQIRASAVRAIEATNACDENDEDNDESADEDSDEHDNEDEDADGADEHAAPATASGQITFTGTDPKAIADQAVAAMTLAFNTAKATLDALPTPTPHATRTPETRTSDHKSSDRGHDEHDGHDGDDD